MRGIIFLGIGVFEMLRFRGLQHKSLAGEDFGDKIFVSPAGKTFLLHPELMRPLKTKGRQEKIDGVPPFSTSTSI